MNRLETIGSTLKTERCVKGHAPRHHRQPHPGARSRNQRFPRRGHVTGQALVAQLLRIVRDYNLEEAHRAMEDRAEEAPLIPRIVCSEALL